MAAYEQLMMASFDIIQFFTSRFFQLEFLFNVTVKVNIEFLKVAMLKPTLHIISMGGGSYGI